MLEIMFLKGFKIAFKDQCKKSWDPSGRQLFCLG